MSQLKVIAEDKTEYKVDVDGNGGTINDEKFEWNVLEDGSRKFHIIKNDRSYNVELLDFDKVLKQYRVKVNGNIHQFSIKDRLDELLHSLGMDSANDAKVQDVKAPMPGLVLSLSVAAGDRVEKGDALLILEAMKMENIIKSPTSGIVKNIAVNTGDTVDKNALLVNFE